MTKAVERPLAIDLFCGLGGWTEGLLAEGYQVIGFDIERHAYGDHAYPGQLVIQDVTTLHGSQFKDAALIVCSPPCQEYSYMAMPWKIAKAKAAAIRADDSGKSLADLNRLFEACFRIQKEASIAAGRHIPTVVENVRGAIPWVGRSRWNFGSFHLWGDVPALMPITSKAHKFNPDGSNHGVGSWFAIADSKNRGASVEHTGFKTQGMNWNDRTKTGQDFTRTAGKQRASNEPDPMFKRGFTQTATDKLDAGKHGVDHDSGRKIGGDWFSDPQSTCRRHGSKSKGRKMASAMIAKIPLPLSRHIAATYHPGDSRW